MHALEEVPNPDVLDVSVLIGLVIQALQSIAVVEVSALVESIAVALSGVSCLVSVASGSVCHRGLIEFGLIVVVSESASRVFFSTVHCYGLKYYL